MHCKGLARQSSNTMSRYVFFNGDAHDTKVLMAAKKAARLAWGDGGEVARRHDAGGSIITLQRALDHGDLKVTMRYAHLAPDHLDQVLDFNPLARLYPRQVATDPQRDSDAKP